MSIYPLPYITIYFMKLAKSEKMQQSILQEVVTEGKPTLISNGEAAQLFRLIVHAGDHLQLARLTD